MAGGPGGASPRTIQFLGVGGASAALPAKVATWHQLLDGGRMLDGEVYLAATARPVVAKISAATATRASIADGDKVTIATGQGSVTVPVEVTSMVDDVVWVPAGACPGADHGSMVTVRRSTEETL